MVLLHNNIGICEDCAVHADGEDFEGCLACAWKAEYFAEKQKVEQLLRYKKAIEYLEGKTFRFIKKSWGYLFTRPGCKPDFSKRTILKSIEAAIAHDESEKK